MLQVSEKPTRALIGTEHLLIVLRVLNSFIVDVMDGPKAQFTFKATGGILYRSEHKVAELAEAQKGTEIKEGNQIKFYGYGGVMRIRNFSKSPGIC